MRRGSALGAFGAVLSLLAVLFVSNPATFLANESVPVLGGLALMTGLLSVPEGMLDGFSFDRSLWRVAVMAILSFGLIGGVLWFITRDPAHLFLIP